MQTNISYVQNKLNILSDFAFTRIHKLAGRLPLLGKFWIQYLFRFSINNITISSVLCNCIMFCFINAEARKYFVIDTHRALRLTKSIPTKSKYKKKKEKNTFETIRAAKWVNIYLWRKLWNVPYRIFIYFPHFFFLFFSSCRSIHKALNVWDFCFVLFLSLWNVTSCTSILFYILKSNRTNNFAQLTQVIHLHDNILTANKLYACNRNYYFA